MLVVILLISLHYFNRSKYEIFVTKENDITIHIIMYFF